MKKFILLLFFCLLIFACTRNSGGQYCFKCHVVCSVGGIHEKDTIFCSDDPYADRMQFHDANNNECNSVCQKQ